MSEIDVKTIALDNYGNTVATITVRHHSGSLGSGGEVTALRLTKLPVYGDSGGQVLPAQDIFVSHGELIKLKELLK